MAHDLSFSQQHDYGPRANGIEVPVALKTGQERIELLARIDNGASYSFFQRDYAGLLSLRIEEGDRIRVSTVNGGFEAYGHKLTVEVLGIEATTMVSFYADSSHKRNVLGRSGWLDRIRLGLVDYDHMLYLSAYDL